VYLLTCALHMEHTFKCLDESLAEKFNLWPYLYCKFGFSSSAGIRIKTLTFMAGLFSLSCGAGNFGNIWSAWGQHEIQYTK
jgi:hypothetical protein